MSDWTYHLQDIRTGAWLSRDLPLEGVQIADVLTGDDSMVGQINGEDPAVEALIEEWGTAVYAEKGDQIRFGGLVAGSRVADDGNVLILDIRGFTAYAAGQPYESRFRLWDADATDCLRHIWTWLQDRGQSDLGLVVDNDDGALHISDVQPPPKPARADVTYGPGSTWGVPGEHWPRPPKPRKPKRRKPKKRKRRPGESTAHWTAYLAHYQAALDAWNEDYERINKTRLPEWNAWHKRLQNMRDDWRTQYGDREPYKLSWWDEIDLGSELQRLAQEGDFEWRERHTWGPGKATVNHRLQLGVPTIGADKTATVTWSLGDEELAAWPDLTKAGDLFANRVTALGAGEGRKMKRVQVGADDGRLRRVATISAKHTRRIKRLTALAKEERSYRHLLRDIPEVCVWDTDGTLGGVNLGDLVTVTVTGVWASGGTTHKVVGRRYTPDLDDLLWYQLVRAERSPL